MQPIQLWNVIRNANESVLWTPMWNWNVFSNDALKENYRTSIKESIAPVISGLKIEDFSSNRTSEELKASSVLFLLYCAIEGAKSNLEDYFKLLGREIPPRPEPKWENGAPVSVEDPCEQDRKLPARLLALAENVLERYPVGDHGNDARCRIIWESPMVMDDRSKKIVLSVWHHIGFAESHLDIWGNRESKKWNTGGDNYGFFLRCVHLLNEARASHERNGRVLEMDVSPQIRSLVPDLNAEKAWFKQVSVSRFLDMNGEAITLYSKCYNHDNSSVWVKRGYGDAFQLPTDDRLDFSLKFYVDQAGKGRQKILGRLPCGAWFFESTENRDTYKMVAKKGDCKEYSYPIIVAVAPNESNRAVIQSSEEFFVGRLNVDESESGNRNFYRFETEEEFDRSSIKLLPTIPVLLRPKRKLLVEYCPKGLDCWLPVENVCIDWPHAPQSHCFANIQWRKNETFENADMLEDFRSFAVKDFRLNMDGASQQGVKIALLPSDFTIREQYNNQSMLSGVKFYKYGDVELGRDELEMFSVEGGRGVALINTMDGGVMRISFDVRLTPPVNMTQTSESADNRPVVRNVVSRDDIAVLRSGSSLESIEKLLMLRLKPDDDHIVRVVENGVSLQDLSDRSVVLSRNVMQRLLYTKFDNFIWIINHGYPCTEDNIIAAITGFDPAIDNFVYRGASVSQKVLKAALEKRPALWNDIAQWDYPVSREVERAFFDRNGYIESFKAPCLKLQQLFVNYNWKNIYRIQKPERAVVSLAIEKCNYPAERARLFKLLDSMPVMSFKDVLGLSEPTVVPEYGDGPILPGFVGSRVKHKNCSDWGVGVVTSIDQPHHLKIRFENGPAALSVSWTDFERYLEFV